MEEESWRAICLTGETKRTTEERRRAEVSLARKGEGKGFVARPRWRSSTRRDGRESYEVKKYEKRMLRCWKTLGSISLSKVCDRNAENLRRDQTEDRQIVKLLALVCRHREKGSSLTFRRIMG